MRRIIAIASFVLIASACTGAPDANPPATTEGTTSIPSADVDASPTSATMAAALRQLVAKDHTFGQGPPPFTEYLILSSLDPAAGTASNTGAVRPLTEAEIGAIEAAIGEFGQVTWIDDSSDFISDDLTPTIEGAVIIGVGEPAIDEDTALVPVSLWCGGLCGTWLTYRVDFNSGTWVVVGIEGPRAIS